ncbi:hypothetical protein GGI23_006156, partial [Coemansia sp. RSA 2559]
IRQMATDQLFAMICINGVLSDLDDERMERIQAILTETEWMSANEDEFKRCKTELAELVNLDVNAAAQ